MYSATKSTYMRIWTWVVWVLLVLALLTAPQTLLQEGHPIHAVGVVLESEDARDLYPWLPRTRWRKWAWRRYQAMRRRHRQAVRQARKAWLLLRGVRTLAGLCDLMLQRQISRQVSSLPVMYVLLERLQVRRIINKYVPTRAQVDVGTVALVLILNRLQTPQPLYRIADWMGRTVLVYLLDIDPAKFNDDRLARALDALAPHIEAIWEEILAEAMRQGGIELKALFYDLTAYIFHGRYRESDLVDFGFAHNTPSNKRKVKLGLNVLAGSLLPGPFQVWPGRTADQATVASNIERLSGWLRQFVAPDTSILVVTDRVMLHAELAFQYQDAGLSFLSGLSSSRKEVKQLLAEGDEAQFQKFPLESGPNPQYWGRPCTFTFEHEERKMQVRGLVVLSGPMRQQWRESREKQMEALEQELQELQARIGEPRLRTPRIVARRAQARLNRSPVGKFYHLEVQQVEGHVSLRWQRDEQALAQAERLDGRYLLVTNQKDLPYQEMFQRYREKDGVEKAFRISKQELRVAPLYLHKDQRIRAMIFLNMIALLARQLLAHQLRQQGVTASLQHILRTLEETTLIESHFLDGSLLKRLAPLSDEAKRFWPLVFEAVAALDSDTPFFTLPLWLLPSPSSQPATATSPPFP